jgi:hypothetical protein
VGDRNILPLWGFKKRYKRADEKTHKMETHILYSRDRVGKKEILATGGKVTRNFFLIGYILWGLGFQGACLNTEHSRGPLISSWALERYDRKIFLRPDGSYLDCYISLPLERKPVPLVFFCQGSGYASLFEELPLGDYADVNGWIWNHTRYGEKIRLAFVEKRGVAFGSVLQEPGAVDPPKEFLLHDKLKDRCADVCQALHELVKDPLVDPRRVVLLGYGEGALVAARAALSAPEVTHLGFFAAGGQPRLTELTMLHRQQLRRGRNSAEEVEEGMNDFFLLLEEIFDHPDAQENSALGVTPAHLVSYGLHAPLDDLLKLDIPIFYAVAGADPLVPIS